MRLSTRGRETLVSCALLVVVTTAIYGSAFHHPFVDYDDTTYITRNPHVQAGLTWQTFTWALTATDADNWHPLTWLSHALDCQLFGLNPTGHHGTSILIHVLNVVLLFLLLVQGTGAIGRSGLVAALFALHPINVESVAWVAERKNVLSTLLFLLALAAYGWYTRRPSVRRYLVVSAFFVLGLAAKPMVITIPFVFLLLDMWPLQRISGWPHSASRKRSNAREKRQQQSETFASRNAGLQFRASPARFSQLLLEKLPLLVLAAASALITIFAQKTNAMQTLQKFPLDVRLENAIYSYAMYVYKAFWPMRLAVYYPHPGRTLAAWQLGLAASFLSSISVLVWKHRLTRTYLVTGWLWYLITLLPVIGLIQVGNQAMADRYAYIPLLGIFVIVVWGVADLIDLSTFPVRWRDAVSAAILAALSFLTWRQIGYWRSNYDLWSHTVLSTRDNSIAEEKLSIALAELGRDEQALPGLEKAARLNPGDPTRHANLGKELIATRRWQEALAEYEKAIQVTSNVNPHPQWNQAAILGIRASCYESMATIYNELGDYSMMRESYRQALKIAPQQAPAMADRMSTYADSDPSGKHYLQLAVLSWELGQEAEGDAAYQQALELDPSLKGVKQALETDTRNDK